jgi:hypothetical protein
MDLSRNREGHIIVASCTKERKIGPFNTAADFTTKYVLDQYAKIAFGTCIHLQWKLLRHLEQSEIVKSNCLKDVRI